MDSTCLRCGAVVQAERIECLGFTFRPVCYVCCERSVAEAKRDEMRKLEAERRESWRKRCPRKFQDHDFNHPDVDQVVAASVLKWQPGSKGIGLFGEGDSGKTWMLFALLKKLHFQGIEWKAITATELGRLYAWTTEGRAKAQAEEDRLCRVHVLFIDDLGKERKGTEIDAISERFFHVLDSRSKEERPVLWTSNFKSEDDWAQILGERGEYILRRLMNCSQTYEVKRGRRPTQRSEKVEGCRKSA